MRAAFALLAVFAACSGGGGAGGSGPDTSALRIAVLDGATGELTPARVEILDERGAAVVPEGALRVRGDCDGHPASGWDEARPGVFDPASGHEQFYVTEPMEVALPPGSYRVTAQKGLEYERRSATVVVDPGEVEALDLELAAWANASDAGWFSADDHLHIGRDGGDVDATVVRWMQAEDLNVANLLQMGSPWGVADAPQQSFGVASVHQDQETIVASAQENPRTWLLGHGIVLGASSYLDAPDRYLVYPDLWRQARAQGALNGYAHFRAAGLYLDAPEGTIDFLEILQFDVTDPTALYDVLNLGIRITPTAGTDFPCWPSGPPGTQRFYTRVDGTLSYASWLEGVRLRRTFVTNGPLLDFHVNDAGIGEDLRLDAAGAVRLTGVVRFDPERDDVSRLEVVKEGEVVHVETERSAPGVIELDVPLIVSEPTWLALRATGSKIGSLPVALDGEPRPSAAHTAAIFVDVAGGRPLAERSRAARVSRRVLRRLDDLAARFSPEGIERLREPFAEDFAGVDADTVLRDREAVLDGIAAARRFYEAVASGTAPADDVAP